MKIAIIAAFSKRTRAIGLNNKLIWKIPEDLKRFKILTIGQVVIMGRKTFDSIGRKPLPGRKNIVITSKEADSINTMGKSDLEAVRTIEEAVRVAKDVHAQTTWIIGGEEIFKQFLDVKHAPVIDCLELTEIYDEKDGDTHFPEIPTRFKESVRVKRFNEEDVPPYDWVTYIRK